MNSLSDSKTPYTILKLTEFELHQIEKRLKISSKTPCKSMI